MDKRDPHHPIWNLLNLLVIAGLVLFFSWSNASNFDDTEVKMITEIILLVGGWEIAKRVIQKKE